MRLVRTPHFLRAYHKAPEPIRLAFDRNVALLLQNLLHPSLRAKKYDKAIGLWRARVNDDWRFYFTIEGDAYALHEIQRHPK